MADSQQALRFFDSRSSGFSIAFLKVSRSKNVARNLISGYAVMAAGILLAMASVPLALQYLSKEEFGLWAVVSQIAGYLNLVDLGMSNAIGRLLIDYKDGRGVAFGAMVKTSFFVLLALGVFVTAAGLSLAFMPPELLRVPQGLHRAFFWLMAGQAILLGAGFPGRICGHLLYAHQRLDVVNYAQVSQFVVQLGAMWVAFAWGTGVYGQLIGAVAGTIVAYGVGVTFCLHLGFWPKSDEWGAFSRQKFKEIFGYGVDMFAVSLGSQLINSSQTILASRLFGVDLAAVWAVATKAFNLAFQFVWRIWAAAAPAFSEMQAQGDETRIRTRYRGMFVLVTTLGSIAAVAFAVCNGPFLAVWTNGKIGWASQNNWLLGLWLILLAQVSGHGSLIMSLKRIRALKFIYFAEGMTFVLACLALSGWGGFSVFLLCSIVCTSLFTYAYSTWRIAGLMHVPVMRVLIGWQKPMLMVLAWLIPLGVLLQWTTQSWPLLLQLAVRVTMTGLVGALLFLRYGLSVEWVERVGGHLPGLLRSWFVRIAREVAPNSRQKAGEV